MIRSNEKPTQRGRKPLPPPRNRAEEISLNSADGFVCLTQLRACHRISSASAIPQTPTSPSGLLPYTGPDVARLALAAAEINSVTR